MLSNKLFGPRDTIVSYKKTSLDIVNVLRGGPRVYTVSLAAPDYNNLAVLENAVGNLCTRRYYSYKTGHINGYVPGGTIVAELDILMS